MAGLPRWLGHTDGGVSQVLAEVRPTRTHKTHPACNRVGVRTTGGVLFCQQAEAAR
ncbi:MAG: hypothetical protein LKI03_09820 [Acetobacter indonesiensis]|nr:hypothetical protein [Acetobacter indonesiensis]MCI1547002.1 hypothetical protein [Acetobacter indonesiensis]MCI1766326.1 hypothetical protein [Acetobacter indonesiensis]